MHRKLIEAIRITIKMKEIDRIEIRDAQENNLRHVDVDIPKGQLVVLAGVSGSVCFKDLAFHGEGGDKPIPFCSLSHP